MDNLDAKQVKFIDAYFKCNDVKSVCKERKISINTYYKYLNDKAIKKEINHQLNQILQDTSRYLQNNLNKCSVELMDIIDNKETPPQTKINAINSMFNISLKLTEQTNILDRLEQLEIQQNIE